MTRVLVTGGKGFLGRHLVAKLNSQGKQVRVLARGAGNGPRDCDADSVVWADIRDRDAVDRAVEGMDVVVHLVSNFRRGGSDRKEAYGINVDGTMNVMRAAARHGVQRVVHCSTIGVHGNVLEIPANEETPYNPGDLYQETKLQAEQKVWAFHEQTGLPVSVVRPISLMGPGDVRMLKLFRMIQHRRFVMVGGGDVYFQPAYIDDVVHGFCLCMEHPGAVGQAFIIGGQEYVLLRDLVHMIADELGVPAPKYRIPLRPVVMLAGLCEAMCVPLGIEPPIHRRRVSFFQNNRAFSIHKAQKILGFEPEFSLQDAIRLTSQWYRNEGLL
ncbi:NAD-dependent epimerase/dehydratase family protein [Desulfovermiculus halophilus]|uniref:NAD-dependent epimerase/dehydratase family protein n=1 Tax=Desulfovermiculus halophilus TaxID=339722 RepID=UPI00048521D6|nr:NAD-dependent epimerase/dehydratase family protein [Desulfovermiculus halophilus]